MVLHSNLFFRILFVRSLLFGLVNLQDQKMNTFKTKWINSFSFFSFQGFHIFILWTHKAKKSLLEKKYTFWTCKNYNVIFERVYFLVLQTCKTPKNDSLKKKIHFSDLQKMKMYVARTVLKQIFGESWESAVCWVVGSGIVAGGGEMEWQRKEHLRTPGVLQLSRTFVYCVFFGC